jgi:hypothetical protein
MITIYKYDIPLTDHISLPLPLGSEILSVGNQRERLCIWALIDTDVRTEKVHKLRVAGTGHPLNEDVQFLGTVQFMSGDLIFHVFEILE